MTEQHLIHALREGNEAAFKILVESYKNQLYNTILGFIQNTEEAEDVLQDVFIKVFENIASFKNDSSLGTWMYRIAVTQSLDHIRRKNRKKRMGTLLSLFGAAEPIENI